MGVNSMKGSGKAVILALIATGEVSGPCRGLFQLVEQTKDMDIQFALGMFLVRSFATTSAIEEARRRGFRTAILSQRSRYDLWVTLQAQKLIEEHGITILQSHGYKPALVAWWLKRLTGRPWVAFAHGYTLENRRVALYNRLDRWLLRRADRVIAVSEASAAALTKAGVPARNIRVIANAIDPTDYRLHASGEELRKSWGAGERDLLIGVIGRLSPEKGHKLFLKAFRLVRQDLKHVKSVFVGDGPERRTIEAAIREGGMGERITLAGYHADVSSVYAALDLVVIPSLSEGLPNVLLEALLHRKPVVATSVGGIPEVMLGPLARWLVPPGDAAALAQAMKGALVDSQARTEFIEAGEDRVLEAYSPTRRAQQIVAVYRELTGAGGGC